jgi:H+-transporting ATPase
MSVMNPKPAQAKASASTVDPKDDLKTLPMPEVEKRLGTTTDGLTQAEATKRLTQYGPNEITEKKTNPLSACQNLLGAAAHRHH